MGTFSRESFKTDRYDHIKDFTQTIALVPTSAKTGEGIPELLMVLSRFVPEYLKRQLQTTEGSAKGTVLEVKEEPGLGLTLNTIIYDGTLQKTMTYSSRRKRETHSNPRENNSLSLNLRRN